MTTTTAILNGTVNPNGTITAAKFQIGTTMAYSTDIPILLSLINGVTDQNASVLLTGLTPGTTYHFHVTATNAVGTTDSGDLVFTAISLSDANLSGLVPSSGVLSPGFTSANISYTDSVSNSTVAFTVTPTAVNVNSTIQVRVNGGPFSAVASGSASGSLVLNVGANTVDVLVTAQDGTTTKTYSIGVTRRTPYQDCAVSLGLSGAAMDPNGDFDGDGVKNVVEWAFGTNPASGVNNPIRVVGASLSAHGSPLVLHIPNGSRGFDHYALFGRRRDAATVGLAYAVEFSADLSSWTVGATTPTVVAQDSELEAVTIPFPALVNGWPPAFFRVRVTAQ